MVSPHVELRIGFKLSSWDDLVETYRATRMRSSLKVSTFLRLVKTCRFQNNPLMDVRETWLKSKIENQN